MKTETREMLTYDFGNLNYEGNVKDNCFGICDCNDCDCDNCDCDDWRCDGCDDCDCDVIID